MNETTTTDLSKFGYSERVMAEKLLHEWNEQNLPDDFYNDNVTIMMNTESGNVFLTNSDYQVAMLIDDKLLSFYSCPQCGNEGIDSNDCSDPAQEGAYPFKKYNSFCSKECENKDL